MELAHVKLRVHAIEVGRAHNNPQIDTLITMLYADVLKAIAGGLVTTPERIAHEALKAAAGPR